LKSRLLLFLTGVVLTLTGCGMDKEKGILMAAGSYGDLAVVVSDPALRPLADRFLAGFNREVTFVIKPESTFQVDVFGPDRWDSAKGYKNVLFLVHIGQGGGAEKAARKQITETTWDRLAGGGGGVVQAKDPWSTYQHLVVAASKDRNSLGSILNKNSETIRSIFENSNRERILRRNRHDGLNTNLINAWSDRLGFYMEIPGTYTQNQLRPDGFPGVEMMRQGPSRGISVSWLETKNPAALLADREKLVQLRTEMGVKLHNEDIIPETFVWKKEDFGAEKGITKLEGSWTSNRFAGGGAFWSYFYADESKNRVYCLDLLVYAPGMDKMPLFRRMDAIASTFATKRPQP
jgi:Domain of unknown function (DUF4837)